MPVLGETPDPVPRIRNSGSTTHCLSTQACQPNSSSTPLFIRQCDDWNHDTCSVQSSAFAGQIWRSHTAGAGEDIHVIVANVSLNNSDPQAASLCLTAPPTTLATNAAQGGVTDADTVRLEPCAAMADAQIWKWSTDPLTSGDTHPDHPGTTIESTARTGQCLSTSFTEQEMNEVYVGKLESKEKPGTHEGSWVIAMFNRSPLPRPITLSLQRLEYYGGRLAVNSWNGTDIWAKKQSKKDMGTLRSSDGPLTRVVAPHDVVLLRLDAVPTVTKDRQHRAQSKTDDDSEASRDERTDSNPLRLSAWNPYPLRGPRFLLTDHGGVGDNKTMNTRAFEHAFAACVAAGHGYVEVPAGAFRTGTVHLQSNC
jgi:hypothetical protein